MFCPGRRPSPLLTPESGVPASSSHPFLPDSPAVAMGVERGWGLWACSQALMGTACAHDNVLVEGSESEHGASGQGTRTAQVLGSG